VIPEHRVFTSPNVVAIRHTERLGAAGAMSSVGSMGDSYDALAETVNGIYKAELIRGPDHGPWRDVDEVELAALAWSTGTTPNGSTATSTTSRPPSSNPRSTLPTATTQNRSESNSRSLPKSQGDLPP
jgi:hypothetical protein